MSDTAPVIRPRLNLTARKLVLEHAEYEREFGDPSLATALETLLDWHDADHTNGDEVPA